MLDLEHPITLTLDFTVLTLVMMLLFALIGARRGWRTALVTLGGLFLAWGLALQTTDFLIRSIRISTGYDFSTGDMRSFFQLGLYVSSVVMVVYTFNSIISPAVTDQRDKITAASIGLLNGYMFMLQLLNLSREWLANHVNEWTLTLNAGYAFELDPGQLTLITKFQNNALDLYPELMRVQNIVLLFFLLVFWHGLIFGVLTGLDKRLRPAKK